MRNNPTQSNTADDAHISFASFLATSMHRNTNHRIISNTSNRYIELMIVIKLQQLAKKHGIENAYQFQKFTGFPPSHAAHLWKEKWAWIKNSNLNKLCNAFKCTPNDIFEFTPDEEEQ